MKTFKQFLEAIVINPPTTDAAKKAKKRVSANTTIPASDTTSNYPSDKASDKGEF